MAKKKRNYKLPEPLICDVTRIENGVTMELVKEFIKLHEERLPRYEYLENLYKGFHDIYNEPEKPSWKPDNRLVVNFPRYIVDTFIGYAYGVPIKVTHLEKKVDEAIQLFGKDNEITDHEAEMAKICCQYGHGFEFIYQDEESKTKVTAVTPHHIFIVYDDTVKNRALFVVRYGYKAGKNGKCGDIYGEILTHNEIARFAKDKITERLPNQYGYIPIIEWRLNDERMGLYEPVNGLIETYNKTIAEKANDVDAFAEAYLAVLGAELDENGVYKIRDNRIINIFGTNNAKDVLVQFLSKPTADETQENLLNRLERLIFQTTMVANISDESFANATSGVALAYKLQAMSNLAMTFDRKIEKSLRKRYKIFCSLGTNVSNPDAYQDLSFTMTRNVPKNISDEANTAARLEGIISKETQLKTLSIVDDVKAEIDKMKEEEEEKTDKVLNAAMFRKENDKTGGDVIDDKKEE